MANTGSTLTSQDAAAALSEAVAAILATVPNAANCIDGLDTTFYRVLSRRYERETGGVIPDASDYDHPCNAPWYSPLKRRVRERIVAELDKAIDASGLTCPDSDEAVYTPLIELEDQYRKGARR